MAYVQPQIVKAGLFEVTFRGKGGYVGPRRVLERMTGWHSPVNSKINPAG